MVFIHATLFAHPRSAVKFTLAPAPLCNTELGMTPYRLLILFIALTLSARAQVSIPWSDIDNGFFKFSGATSSIKTYTLPNANATLLFEGGPIGSVTPASGAFTSISSLGVASFGGVAGNGAAVTINPATSSTQPTGIRIDGTYSTTANSTAFYGAILVNNVTWAKGSFTGLVGYGARIANPSVTGAGTIDTHYGLYIDTPNRGAANYSIYSAGGSNVFIGGINSTPIGGSAPASAAFTDITMGSGTGTVTAASGVFSITSDQRAKNHHADFTRGLADVIKLHPAIYDFKADAKHTLRAGFYTQDVEPAIPEAVFHDQNNGMASLDDRPIIAALVNAVKEIDAARQSNWKYAAIALLSLVVSLASFIRRK